MVEEWKENSDNNLIVGAVLTDISKAFDCWLRTTRVIDRKTICGLNSDSLCYIYSYLKDREHLKDREQGVQINSEQSEFDSIISGCTPRLSFRTNFIKYFFKDFFKSLSA